jgi:CBS-domain-containing membrane protein
MNSAIERLMSLRIRDIMSPEVVQVPAHQTMATAAEILRKHEVTGAPVVDEQGRCVGMISGSDFVVREHVRSGSARSSGEVEYVLVRDVQSEPYHVEYVHTDLVSNHMSSAVQTVSTNTTIIEAARVMCGEHIHRLVVLDHAQRPVGVASSLDVIAAVVNAVNE